ncbi:MAG TPA: hypothetical protein VI215_11710 [Bacteroidota bacterium]|jgi:hypothetical protein
MTILPHLLLTTVGVQVLGLEGKDVALAYTFGYGIDLVDHPIKLKLYLRKNGKKNESNYHWRTPLQEPVALLWIVPLGLYLGTWVPALFFASHFFLDYLVGYEKRPFYPFSTYSTEGLLGRYSDGAKEIWTCAICAAVSIALGYQQILHFASNLFS